MRRGNDLKRFSTRSLSTQTRHYGFFQTVTNVETGVGDYEGQWADTTAQPHSMSIEPFSPKQIDEWRSINVEADHLIKIRGELNLSEDDRVRVPGTPDRFFEIKTVRDIQDRGIVKHVVCKEYRD